MPAIIIEGFDYHDDGGRGPRPAKAREFSRQVEYEHHGLRQVFVEGRTYEYVGFRGDYRVFRDHTR